MQTHHFVKETFRSNLRSISGLRRNYVHHLGRTVSHCENAVKAMKCTEKCPVQRNGLPTTQLEDSGMEKPTGVRMLGLRILTRRTRADKILNRFPHVWKSEPLGK